MTLANPTPTDISDQARVAATPGPWSTHFGSRTGQRRVFKADDLIEVRSENGVVACLWERNWASGADYANARLISAAPDMLAALREARLTLSAHEGTDYVLSLVEAAIAKAEAA